MQEMFIHAEEVRKLLGISRSKAYGIVRQLNDELKERGLITLNGKVSRKYFAEWYYVKLVLCQVLVQVETELFC